MLPRRERLSTAEFARAFAAGRVLRHPLLQVRVVSRNGDFGGSDAARAAFVVSRKMARAAARNRLRRRLREAYRLSELRGDARLHDRDLIFLATPAALTAPHDILCQAVEQMLERAAAGSATTLDRRQSSASAAAPRGITTTGP